MSQEERFEIRNSDGVHGHQVLIFDDDDYRYWSSQAKLKGYRMVYSYSVPVGALGHVDVAHDVYQLLPKGTA